MKKVVAGILALIMVLGLAGCGGDTTPSASAENETIEPEAQGTKPETVQPEDNTATSESDAIVLDDFPTFSFPAEKMADILQQIMQEKFTDSMTEEPTIKNEEASDGLPAFVAYTYDVGSDVYLTLYETAADQKMYQAFLYTKLSATDLKDALNRTGYISGSLLGLLEDDQSVAERIMTELNTANVTNKATTMSYGNASEWTYIVNDDSLMFNIMAK